MKFAAIREFALALPDATEEPHHRFGSFRVSGKIFATFTPDEQHLHLFLAETHREEALALHPQYVERLLWGGKVVGVRIELGKARAPTVEALLRRAWEDKSPAKPGRGSIA